MIISQLRPASLYVMPNMALLSGFSFVFSPSLGKALVASPIDPAVEYYPEEVANRLRRTQSGDNIAFEICNIPRVIAHLKGDCIPLNLLQPTNYYHFLIEWLPTIAKMVEEKALDKNSIIVSGVMHSNMWSALRFVLSDMDVPVFQMNAMQAVMCDRVVMGPASSHASHLLTGGISDYWYDNANILLLRRLFRPLWANEATPSRKLYVRRVSDRRTLTNGPEIEQLAIDAGYEIVQPERMGILEQIRLFSSASHIMGPTGAWAANLLFVHESAKVNIFYPEPAKREKSVWGALGEVFGLKVNDVYCPVARLHEQYPIHSDYIPPLEVCRGLLRE